MAGAVALAWSGEIHLYLWSDGYKDISVIGPLFLAQGIGCVVLAVVVALLRWLALFAAGALTLAATAGGLLLAANGGIFGYTESLVVPDAQTSLGVEFGGAAVLAVAVVILLAGRHES